MKVCIAVCNGGTIKSRTVTDLFSAIVTMTFNLGVGVVWAELESNFSFDNRWRAVHQARETGCEYLWFIDADQTIPADAFEKLLAHDVEIVGAAYNYRKWPRQSTVKMLDASGKYTFLEHVPSEPFIAAAIGFGCVLIKMDVFNKVPQPWFKCDHDPITGQMIMTEDTWFCQQAKKRSIPVWVDPTIKVGHLGDYEY